MQGCLLFFEEIARLGLPFSAWQIYRGSEVTWNPAYMCNMCEILCDTVKYAEALQEATLAIKANRSWSGPWCGDADGSWSLFHSRTGEVSFTPRCPWQALFGLSYYDSYDSYDDMMISYLMISLRSKGYFRAGRAALEFWPELTNPIWMAMASTSHLWKPRMEFYSEALELFQQGLEKEPGILDAEFLDVEVLMTIYQCIDLEHNFYINIPAYNSCYSYWCLVEFHQLHVHFGHPEAQQQRPGSLDPESPRHQKSTSAGRFTPGTGENLQLDSWNPGFVTMDIWYYWSCTHDFEVKGEVGEEAHHWLFEIWLSGSAAERRRGWGGGSHYKSDWHSYHLVAPNAARPPMIPTASSWVTSAHEQKINRFYPDTRHYQIADVKSKHSMSCENPDQIFIVPP